MTETLGTARSVTRGATPSPLGDLAHSEAVDRLRAELREYLAAQAQRLLVGIGRRLGETTLKLNDIAEGRSPGFAKLALDGGRKLAEGKGPLRSALELGAARAKDNIVGAGKKPTVVIESVDVGVPLRTAYDQWTRYQQSDDTQISDDRIAWTSEGVKGATKDVVSFHPLADTLTRVLLVIEYYPKGLFGQTGNLWRAQGRRARLNLKNYVRHVTLKEEADEEEADEYEYADGGSRR